jgi:tRNA 2-thiouridine synthesizing protein E
MSLLDNIEFDEQGYMLDEQTWTAEIGQAIAEREGLDLTSQHWEIIKFVRTEFHDSGTAPTIRRITRNFKINTKELFKLFPRSPVKLAAMIAGLSEPTRCI